MKPTTKDMKVYRKWWLTTPAGIRHKRLNRDRDKKWRRANPEKYKASQRAWAQQNRELLRENQRRMKRSIKWLVLKHYGGNPPVCACCGENGYVFLTIDHIDGNGSAHRRKLGLQCGHRFYAWLKRSDFPPGFQVLCYNCNYAKRTGFECPHKTGQTGPNID